ncbi:MAG: macro domain-containing protein [Limnochordia bacterium]
MKLEIVQGDISQCKADAIVNAAGTSLAMGSGVAGALRRRGGEELHRAAVAQGPIGLGQVAVTPAFGLDAQYVIHAAAMPHYGDGRATTDSIREATRQSLFKAEELGCTSIVFPALGCGIAGFPLAEGLRIMLQVIMGFSPKNLQICRLVLYTSDDLAVAQEVYRDLSEG